MSQILTFIIWLGLVVAGGEALNWLLVRAVPYRIYRWALAPGIIVHELSHAMACFLVGAQIHELALLSPTGGHVKHTEPRVPYIGNALIALAPIGGGLVVIVVALAGLNPNLFQALISTDINQSITTIFAQWGSAFAQNFSLFSIKEIVMLLILITVGASLAPSWVDLRSAGAGLVIALAATVWQLWLAIFLFIALVEIAKQHENITYVAVDAALLGGGVFLATRLVSPEVAQEALTMATLLSMGAILIGLVVAVILYSGTFISRKRRRMASRATR